MGVQSEDLLIANGIVRSRRNEIHEFVCSVCTDEISFEDWEQHVGDELHIRTLEQFNLTFEKTGAKIHCKLCNADIDWNEVKAHGKSHLIVPWHEPEDKYRTFFENRTIGCKTELYCCLCDTIFLDWSTAFLHINDQRHRNLKEEITPLADEFSSKLPADVTYESLITDGLVPFDEKTLECRICDDRNIVEFTEIVNHVGSFLHSWDKITFAGKLKELKASKSVAKHFENWLFTESTSKQLVNTKTNQDQCCQSLHCYYLEKLDVANFRCNVCDCLVFASILNTSVHVAGVFHANSLKKYGCDDISLKEGNTYHCKCCKGDIPGLEELCLHVKNKYHSIAHKLSEVQTKLQDIPDKVETESKKNSETELALSVSPTNNFHCENGTNHVSSPEEYGCDKISRKTDNIIYRQCRDGYILGLERVQTHVKEEKHIETVGLSDKQQSPVSDNNPIEVVIPKQPKPHVPKIVYRPTSHCYIRRPRAPKPLEPLYPNVVGQTIPSNYIRGASGTDPYCIVCNVKLSTSAEIDNHIVGSGHKIAMNKYGCDNVRLIAGNLYYCRCCNCRIFGHDNVYLHVKGRQHDIEHMEQIRKKNPEEASVQPTKVALSSILTNDVTKMVEEAKSKEAAYASRARLSRVGFPNPRRFVAEERTPCNVCNVIFTSSAELHTHLASHFSGDFVRFNANKNSKISTNDTASKVQMGWMNTVRANEVSTEAAKTLYERHEIGGFSDDNTKSLKPRLTNGTSVDSIEETVNRDNEDDSDTESRMKPCTPKKTIMRRISQLLNFDEDYIYDMKDKLRETELGMKLCLTTDSTSIYCLVCRKTVDNTLQDYFEHLCSLDHCDYLEKMVNDDELFDRFPDQFSELALAFEYMEESSDEAIRCLVCHEEVANDDDEIRDHIDEGEHEEARDHMHTNAKQRFEDVESRMQCDWYNVQNYWCVLCSANFESEASFAKHLASAKHAVVVGQSDNVGRALIYDFCAPCALLWYGYRCTHAYHCNVSSHKWFVQDGHYVLCELPEMAKNLLATPERYINDTMEYLDSVAMKEREKERSLTRDLENAVKRRFYNAKTYTYGSRVSGLGAAESNVDVFLDCGGMYNGNVKSKDQVASLMTSVHQCLSRDSQFWVLDELLKSCRTPIVRARHRATGLSCDISFENGLSVENTKLIKSFNDVFPPCRKMIILLKKWLVFCKLSGPDRISSYALYWFVIFYLQKETILPSIATLIRMNSRSHEIAGWEVGVTREYSYNKAESNLGIKELLVRFFMFYADFDFRHDVACPLLGDAMKKREFADHRNLPKEMRPYVEHMKKSGDPEPLRIDAPMCIQDPLDLQHNITKAVSKVFLSRFRSYCSKSVDVLLSSS